MRAVREMTLWDVDEVAALERTAPDAWSAAALREELASPAARCLVLTQESGLAGFCTVQTAAGEASLNAFTVRPDRRRHGDGTFLLTELLTRLAGERVEEVYLEVRAENAAALGLYRKLGFEVTGRRRSFYKAPPDDAVTMRCRLGVLAQKGAGAALSAGQNESSTIEE